MDRRGKEILFVSMLAPLLLWGGYEIGRSECGEGTQSVSWQLGMFAAYCASLIWGRILDARNTFRRS